MTTARIGQSRLVLLLPPPFDPLVRARSEQEDQTPAPEEIVYEVAAPPLPLAVGEAFYLRRGSAGQSYRITGLSHALHEQDGTVVHALYVTLEEEGSWVLYPPASLDAKER